jgi:hypothetical protein
MDYLDELGRRIARLAGSDSCPLWVEGVLVFATDRVTEPMLTLVAQARSARSLVTMSSTTGPARPPW